MDKWTFGWDDRILAGWSSDTFDAKEEAIAAGMIEARKDGRISFFVGRVVDVGLPVIDARLVLDQLGEQMYDEFETYAEDYLVDVPGEQVKELEDGLNKVFKEWAEKYGHVPNWETIVDEERIEVK